ncbi:hypothetical protein PYW07_011800 [Mythimna separata]|uniref:Cell cycle control protein 50A n=1 Tax=Mythimna separata TaxID=271217 RepID=A0AAD7Y6S2_MYTSE|nr:hypothetical protein PYW07_011800 [Mythimna separata]
MPPIPESLSDKWKNNHHTHAILLGTTIFGVISCIVGIILLCTYVTYDGYEIAKDYTDCTPSEFEANQIRCKDKLNATGKECSCYMLISLTEPMKPPVTVYYELESYDQILSSYSQSRDDNQLAGHLDVEPSESCGSHTYACTPAGRQPIAPCGRLADAMFNDTFSMQTNNEYVVYYKTGLISEADKKPFHNPPGNLSEAFQNFSKPMNWRKNVWELDTSDPNNNGFQNEAFIIWMKSDLKRKPAWRIRHEGRYKDGLPVANYTLKVLYAYPPSRYNGRRKVIISSVQETVNLTAYGFGVALLVIGLPCFIVAGLMLLRKRSAK